jgi:hypothetical protein
MWLVTCATLESGVPKRTFEFPGLLAKGGADAWIDDWLKARGNCSATFA